jgi:hypothetical protein
MRLSQPTRLHDARNQETTNQISTVYSKVPDCTTSWPQCASLSWQPSTYRVSRTYSKLSPLVTNYWTRRYNDPKTTSEIFTERSIRLHVTTQNSTSKTFTVGNHPPDCHMQRPRRRQSHVIREAPMIEQHYTEPVNPRHSNSSERKLHCVRTQTTTA